MGSAVRNAVARALAGIKAYHSSPHDFDKFDVSKIGTGEGAQVYGRGIYFAENPKVSGQGGEYWQNFLHRFSGPERELAEQLRGHNFDRSAMAKTIETELDDYRRRIAPGGPFDKPHMPDAQKRIRDYIDELSADRDRILRGEPVGPRTYEVNINAKPEAFLDWDALLPQQPEGIQRLARDVPRVGGMDMVRGEGRNPTGEAIYRRVQAMKHDAAPKVFEHYGVPGVRYLDQGSRTASVDIPALQMDLRATVGLIGQLTDPANIAKHQAKAAQIRGLIERAEAAKAAPTSNYVIFDPNSPLSKVDIVKKYAVPGAIGTGTMGAVFDPSKYTAEEVQR